jgi:hypothetical protein
MSLIYSFGVFQHRFQHLESLMLGCPLLLEKEKNNVQPSSHGAFNMFFQHPYYC